MTGRIRMLLGLLVLCAIAGAVTSAAYAAGSGLASSTTSQTAFDPFTLRTYTVQGDSTGTAMDMSVLVASRLPIRIPFRPPLRSPFRPDW